MTLSKTMRGPKVDKGNEWLFTAITSIKVLNSIIMTKKNCNSNSQTKIHEALCEQRTLATIATHNLASLTLPLVYDAAKPEDIYLEPLGRHKKMNAQELIATLKTEALKQKQQNKRNPLKSGLYK